ncbi:hypothetical protein Tco_1244930 [Tanacetum coccineum]
MGGQEVLVDIAVKTADTVVYFQFTYGMMEGPHLNWKVKADPLNFDKLLMKAKAACPASQHKGMSSSEIHEMVNERLSMHDMTPEGGCSKDFRKKLKEFIEKYAVKLEITMGALQPHVGELNDEESEILETVAQSISGITFLAVAALNSSDKTKLKDVRGDPDSGIGGHWRSSDSGMYKFILILRALAVFRFQHALAVL